MARVGKNAVGLDAEGLNAARVERVGKNAVGLDAKTERLSLHVLLIRKLQKTRLLGRRC